MDYGVGHIGSVHNAWAFQSTRTFKEHDKIFGPDKWQWADSAYPSETWPVSPYKKPVGSELSPDQWTYNYYISKVHVTHNHVFFVIKYFFRCPFAQNMQSGC